MTAPASDGSTGATRPRRARTFAVVAGALAALVGLALSAGTVLAVWTIPAKDADGYYITEPLRLRGGTHAITTGELDVTEVVPRFVHGAWFGHTTVRLTAGAGTDTEIFLGIGPADRVLRYLDGVSHSVVDSVGREPLEVEFRSTDGDPPSLPPAEESFWVATATGQGRQTLTWDVRAGQWAAVLMNADGAPLADTDVTLGVRFPFPVLASLLISGAVDDRPPQGIVLGLVGAFLIHWGRRRRPGLDEATGTDHQGVEISAEKVTAHTA